MKFLLMMNSPRDGYDTFLSWPKPVLEANIAFMRDFARKLRESGELVETQGLTSPLKAKKVRRGSDGKPITDGVFPETKEYLAGYWMIDVESEARAIEIAALASEAPGVGPEPLWIEVREVMSRFEG